ncbi:hypothetical protein KCV06_g129, partial [Aureobasidium melanogenum]
MLSVARRSAWTKFPVSLGSKSSIFGSLRRPFGSEGSRNKIRLHSLNPSHETNKLFSASVQKLKPRQNESAELVDIFLGGGICKSDHLNMQSHAPDSLELNWICNFLPELGDGRESMNIVLRISGNSCAICSEFDGNLMMFDGQVEVNEQARINKELTSRKKPTTRSCSHGENEDVEAASALKVVVNITARLKKDINFTSYELYTISRYLYNKVFFKPDNMRRPPRSSMMYYKLTHERWFEVRLRPPDILIPPPFVDIATSPILWSLRVPFFLISQSELHSRYSMISTQYTHYYHYSIIDTGIQLGESIMARYLVKIVEVSSRVAMLHTIRALFM